MKITKQNIQAKIKKHEDNYYHIPKISLLPLLGLILFTLLAIGNYQLIDKNILTEAFSNETCLQGKPCNLTPPDLIILYPTIGEYILISLAFISLIAIFKKGYKNIKKYEENGLIVGLIGGLIVGLIVGLIGGLIFGLISGLIVGLIVGLIGGLIVGLIGGLIFGLTNEFE
jgi:hypothetical protein